MKTTRGIMILATALCTLSIAAANPSDILGVRVQSAPHGGAADANLSAGLGFLCNCVDRPWRP